MLPGWEGVWQRLWVPFEHSPGAASVGLLAAALGFLAAFALYWKAAADPLPEKLGALSRAMRDRFYFDEIYEALFIRPHDFLAAIAAWFDRWIISGVAVRGTHGTTELLGRALRLVQTGNLQTYAIIFALGVAFLLYFALR
jgi:NADH-quinone oxidoreductase subunit L